MDHFVDVISVSEIRESRNVKMTEESNIKRVYAFQIRYSTDCQHSQDLGMGARIKIWNTLSINNHARRVGLRVWKPLVPWHWR